MKYALAVKPVDKQNQGKPKTQIQSGGTKKKQFGQKTGRDKDQIKKWQEIYNAGGLISQAIDSYPLFTLSGGWRWEGENEGQVEQIIQLFDHSPFFDFGESMWSLIVDSYVAGDSFQEPVFSRSGSEFSFMKPVNPITIDMEYDDFGIVSGYTQTIESGSTKKIIKLKPEQILHFALIPVSGQKYGLSALGRAYDEVIRDNKTAEASSEAIDRHGFKKYHIKVGQPGEIIDQTVIKEISDEFEDINTKNEFTTGPDLEINNLDDGGLEKIGEYNDISIMRVCAALGVPEEVLGLRRGSTDNTAVSRLDTFFKKIRIIQRKVERYNNRLLDVITGTPGAVRFILNDISADDEKDKAKWITQMMKATPEDPFSVLPQPWIQKQFGVTEQLESGKSPKTTKSGIKPPVITDRV